jgi:hypothetical protein
MSRVLTSVISTEFWRESGHGAPGWCGVAPEEIAPKGVKGVKTVKGIKSAKGPRSRAPLLCGGIFSSEPGKKRGCLPGRNNGIDLDIGEVLPTRGPLLEDERIVALMIWTQRSRLAVIHESM